MGKYNKSSDKNIFKSQQDITWTDTVIEKDGKETVIFVPDVYNGYGDKRSLKHLTEDVVGKHSDNETAVKAGQKAEEQLEETDFNQVIKKIRQEKFLSQNRALDANIIVDPVTGETIGCQVSLMTTTDSGFVYPRSVHFTQEQMLNNSVMKSFVRKPNDNNNS